MKFCAGSNREPARNPAYKNGSPSTSSPPCTDEESPGPQVEVGYRWQFLIDDSRGIQSTNFAGAQTNGMGPFSTPAAPHCIDQGIKDIFDTRGVEGATPGIVNISAWNQYVPTVMVFTIAQVELYAVTRVSRSGSNSVNLYSSTSRNFQVSKKVGNLLLLFPKKLKNCEVDIEVV